jgi:GDP-mannose 6-dehydrogenase
MKISVFGLGYVGCVSSACLASDGHTVIGVDINPRKVAAIENARSPIVEPGLSEMIEENVMTGRLKATTNAKQAVLESEISLICVGTPSLPNGALDLKYVQRVSEDIGKSLADKSSYHVVVVRSTVLPGTTDGVIRPILENISNKITGKDFGLSFNPEFLREGSAIKDYYAPPRTVIGEWDSKSGDPLVDIYKGLDAPLVRVELPIAEMVKYADNSFHALKVAFANEIGNFCKEEGIDSHHVMDIFSLDTKLNISKAYLKPGSAFGGSCLPKDVRALLYQMRKRDLESPLINAILTSNELQKKRGIDLVEMQGKKKIGVLGMSFKAGTDDLRESPTVYLIETLIGKGYDVRIYDPNVLLGNLYGSNRVYIENHLPHIAKLLVNSISDVVENSDVIIVTTKEKEFSGVFNELTSNHILIDWVRLENNQHDLSTMKYHGIAW